MKASTPSGNPGTDLPTDPRATKGDVDLNGDVVDALDDRLRSAIDDTRPELVDAQLRAVRQLLRPWTVRL